MSLFKTYYQYTQGEITELEAADQFGITVRDLRFRITRLGEDLPQRLSVLDRISANEISREEAASILGITTRQVNKSQETWSVGRPLALYLIDKAVSKAKWEIAKNFAIEFIGDYMTLDQAAEAAKMDTRNMRRWVQKLMTAHFKIPYTELKKLSLNRRREMAKEIRDKEGLGLAKKRVIDEVAKGELDIKKLAEERIMKGLSTKKDRKHVLRKPGPPAQA
jgi:hypothetical protein